MELTNSRRSFLQTTYTPIDVDEEIPQGDSDESKKLRDVDPPAAERAGLLRSIGLSDPNLELAERKLTELGAPGPHKELVSAMRSSDPTRLIKTVSRYGMKIYLSFLHFLVTWHKERITFEVNTTIKSFVSQVESLQTKRDLDQVLGPDFDPYTGKDIEVYTGKGPD